MSNKFKGAGVSPKTFQGIIVERKAEAKEKAEHKRLSDLKRIQEMKSKEGKNPLDVFPKQVWKLMLNQLNPKDRLNLWELHQSFRDIMGKTHVSENLFPQILEFCVDKFWDPDYVDMSDNEFYDSDEEDEEMLNPKAALGEYLEMRLVSKGLRDGVDHYLEEDLLSRLRSCNDGTPRKTVTITFDDYSYSDMKKLDEMITFIEENSLHRFISRSFTVIISNSIASCSEGPAMELKEKITQLLQLSGKHIWHFSLATCTSSSPSGSNYGDLYHHLVKWLSLLPNLRWFQLTLYCNKNCSDCIDPQLLRDHPPPKLDHLQRVDFSIPMANDWGDTFTKCWGAKEAICASILQANPQVTNVHLTEGVHNVLNSVKFLKLETLSLGGEVPIYTSHGIKRIEHITPFPEMKKVMTSTSELNWSLKRLDLRVDMKNDSIAPLLKFLEGFQSLEKLALTVKNVTIGDGIDFLRLPNLKTFNFFFDPDVDYDQPIHFFFSLQFLLYCKNLKKIYLNNASHCFEEMEEYMEDNKVSGNKKCIIDFRGGFGGDLRKSNLWEVFPSLEEIMFNRKEFDDDWDCEVVDKFIEYRHREFAYSFKAPT